MKRPIFLKLLSSYLLVTAAIVALILAFTFQTIRTRSLEQAVENLSALGLAVGQATLPHVHQGGLEGLDAAVKSLGRQLATRITLIDSDGTVLADSEEDPARMENHRARPEVASALAGESGWFVRYSTTLKQDMLYVAVPDGVAKRPRHVVRLSLPLEDIDELIGTLRSQIVRIALIAGLMALVISLFFSQVLSLPIRELSRASRRIASGDFASQVPVRGKDELGDLARNFNDMTTRLQATFSELSTRKEELEGVLSSIREGLFVLEGDGRIRLANQGAAKIVGSENLKGRFSWEVLRSPRLNELLTPPYSRSASAEIELEERCYLTSLTPLRSGQGIVLVLHDITERRHTDQIKKDLIVNVSHELRTPLTAIKGFSETLLEESDHPSEYLEIIHRHTQRLIDIVNDLMVLSELEDRGLTLDLERVDLGDLIPQVLTLFESRMQDKALTLTFKTPEKPVVPTGDAFRLEQLFTNLIDNAVKYTERGGISITLSAPGDQVRIVIADTGVGIPREHLPRIFERFYVVDKSRSRRLGGTGCGLAIAKHIVALHSGEIAITSTGGTSVSVTLPREIPA